MPVNLTTSDSYKNMKRGRASVVYVQKSKETFLYSSYPNLLSVVIIVETHATIDK